MGYLNLLLEEPEEAGLTEETRKILERCLASADRERQIINSMLDFSVLESGKVQLSCTRFFLAELVQSVIDTNGYSELAEITVSIPPATSVTADMTRIFIVMDSVLSNAIRYTNPPRTIVIDYHSEDADPFHHISVSDNGIGIPDHAKSSIFEPFQLQMRPSCPGSSACSGFLLPSQKRSWRFMEETSPSRARRVSGAPLPCISPKHLKTG